jgi:hypothetical protein
MSDCVMSPTMPSQTPNPGVPLPHRRVQWSFKLALLHVVLDWQKISKTISEKIFFYFVVFLSFFGFCVENFENSPSGWWNFFSWNRSYFSETALTGIPSSKVWVAPPGTRSAAPCDRKQTFSPLDQWTWWKCEKCRSSIGPPPPQEGVWALRDPSGMVKFFFLK